MNSYWYISRCIWGARDRETQKTRPRIEWFKSLRLSSSPYILAGENSTILIQIIMRGQKLKLPTSDGMCARFKWRVMVLKANGTSLTWTLSIRVWTEALQRSVAENSVLQKSDFRSVRRERGRVVEVHQAYHQHYDTHSIPMYVWSPIKDYKPKVSCFYRHITSWFEKMIVYVRRKEWDITARTIYNARWFEERKIKSWSGIIEMISHSMGYLQHREHHRKPVRWLDSDFHPSYCPTLHLLDLFTRSKQSFDVDRKQPSHSLFTPPGMFWLIQVSVTCSWRLLAAGLYIFWRRYND